MPVKWLAVGLATILVAAEPGMLQAEEPPDLALLEFLGDFETANGEWIDPLELDQKDINEAIQKPGEHEQ